MRIFVVSSGIKNHKTDILKVFSQSLIENVEVFKTVGQRATPISCIYAIGMFHAEYCYIQVWGIVSFITVRSFHNLRLDKRKSSPHFLFIITQL